MGSPFLLHPDDYVLKRGTRFHPVSCDPASMIMCSLMDIMPRTLTPVVYIPGLIFEALVRVRARLYSSGLLPQKRLPAPVISVGNITMGGAGKTPLVICIAQMLCAFGFSPAVLTRGYGRARPGELHLLAPEETVPSPAETLGDEPALIRRHLPSAWMGVSGNRFAAGIALLKRGKKMVFVLDDGFQHRSLHRDLDIVMIDSSQPLRSNGVFPRGTLREPLSGLRRCHAIMINGSTDPEEERAVETEVRVLNNGASLFHCRQTIRSVVPFASWQKMEPGGRVFPLEPQNPVFLVAALGNPERFERDVRQTGVGITGTRFFGDHHRLTREDWRRCAEEARRSGSGAMITTEKDAVKIDGQPDFPLLVGVQSTEIAEANAFGLLLKKCTEGRR